MIISLAPMLPLGSSDLPEDLGRANLTHRWPLQTGHCMAPFYLVLHQVGFTVPPQSPLERWALTPPFHPYPLRVAMNSPAGGLFSVALSVPWQINLPRAWELPSTLPCGVRTFL